MGTLFFRTAGARVDPSPKALMEWKEYAENELKQLHVYRKQQLLDWPLVKGAINCAVVSCPVVSVSVSKVSTNTPISTFQTHRLTLSNTPTHHSPAVFIKTGVVIIPIYEKVLFSNQCFEENN